MGEPLSDEHADLDEPIPAQVVRSYHLALDANEFGSLTHVIAHPIMMSLQHLLIKPRDQEEMENLEDPRADHISVFFNDHFPNLTG